MKYSFILSTYNDSKTVENCILHIEGLCLDNYELIIANDCSTDNTLRNLKLIKKFHKFRLIDNKVNLGKAKTVNYCLYESKGEIIFIIDTDIAINKENFDEMIEHLKKEEVGAVSCRYNVKNKGIISSMENIEYSMLGIINGMYKNSLTIWGGCSAYKRKALMQINGLKENMLIEDMDSSIRLREIDWKVIQCNKSVTTYTSNNPFDWIKRKIRWTSGGMQCLLHHPKQFLKNPTYIGVFIFYGFIFNLAIFYFLHGRIEIATLFLFFYLITTILFTWANSDDDLLDNMLFVPFALIYYPLYSLISTFGIFIGIYKYIELKEGCRAW